MTETLRATAPGALVLADSISPAGSRLTTFEVTIHRFVLAELNTHRGFSRNSASSRAIPVAKQIARVRDDPAIPIEFGSNKPGMQAGEPLVGEDAADARLWWLTARNEAVECAETLAALGVHKQVTNRLLEPFMWHTVILSTTEAALENFFKQRCSPLAQPEIRAAAEAMRRAYDSSVPVSLAHGGWHLPLVYPEDLPVIEDACPFDPGFGAQMVSVARCARVSYLTHDGRRDVTADLGLFGKLVTADPRHESPLEHVATPAAPGERPAGNFDGWHQLRHTFEAI